MKCVSCLLQGREEIQGGGGGQKAEITGVDQGTEQPLPFAGTFAGLALSDFPSTHLSSPHGRVCWPGPVSPSCLGRKPVVTAELRHMHTEQKQALSVLGSAVQAPVLMP